MEGAGYRERKLVINELMQAYEWTDQLRSHLSPCSPPEMLTQKILCSFNKVLSMLKSGDSEEEPQLPDPASGNDSPHSFSRSPRSERSERQSSKRAFGEPDCRDNSKKRKTIPTWAEVVRVGSGMSLERPPEDGNSWRKYGQKDILGAKYPRAYYRCTNNQCPARKHVQRSDEDPSIFRLVYQGRHTCTQATKLTPGAMAISSSPKLKEQQQQPQELVLNFRTGLRVKAENLESQDPSHSPSSFPYATIDGANPGLIMSTSGASDLTETISTVTSGSNSSPVDPELMNLDEFGTFLHM